MKNTRQNDEKQLKETIKKTRLSTFRALSIHKMVMVFHKYSSFKIQTNVAVFIMNVKFDCRRMPDNGGDI